MPDEEYYRWVWSQRDTDIVNCHVCWAESHSEYEEARNLFFFSWHFLSRNSVAHVLEILKSEISILSLVNLKVQQPMGYC